MSSIAVQDSEKCSPQSPLQILLNEKAEAFKSRILSIPPFSASAIFRNLLNTVNSYQDFAVIFTGSKLEEAFSTKSFKAKTSLVFELLNIEDENKDVLKAKFSLAKSIIRAGVDNADTSLGYLVSSALLKLSLDPYTPLSHKPLFRLEVIDILKDPHVLPGFAAPAVLESLLCCGFPQTLTSTIGLFDGNDDLLKNIISRAFTYDTTAARNCLKELVKTLKAARLDGLLYHAQIEEYAAIVKKIEAFSEDVNTQHSPFDILVQPFEAKSGPTEKSDSKLINLDQKDPAKILAVYAKVFNQNSADIKFKRNRIDSSAFPMIAADIAEGIEKFCELLSPTSPLNKALQSYYQRLPKLVEKYSPQEIKQDLLSFLKPKIYHLEPLDIFGEELGTLKQACLSIYSIVWDNREPTYGTTGRRRNEVPEIHWFFKENHGYSEHQHFDRHNLVLFLDGSYMENRISFVDYAGFFKSHFSIMGESIYFAAKTFIQTYLPEAQHFEPDFKADLKSSREKSDFVSELLDFTRTAQRSSAELQYGAGLLARICEDYLEGRVNDQSFLTEVDNLIFHLEQAGDFDEAFAICRILDSFSRTSKH